MSKKNDTYRPALDLKHIAHQTQYNIKTSYYVLTKNNGKLLNVKNCQSIKANITILSPSLHTGGTDAPGPGQ